MLLSRLLLSGALIGGLSASAQSADLPSRVPAAAPSSAAPVFSWTGFYAGGNMGAGWKRTAQFFPGQNYLYLGSPTSDPDEDAGSNVSSAFIGGLQAGYDHQIGSWVFGVQANVEATSMNGVNSWPSIPNENVSSKAKAFGSFTGRVGYAIQPSLLVYAKGGIGLSRVNYSDDDVTVPISLKASATHWGWTVGAGLEYALTSNWSTFIEYNHADYGSKNVTMTDAAQQNRWYYKYSNRIDTVMVGLNYRFGK
jgi:outer membrane immunogenic protein